MCLPFHFTVYSNTKKLMFYLIEIPFLTTDLLANETLVKSAKTFYSKKEILNEDYGEMWIHRGLKRMTEAQGHTKDPSKADVFFVVGYNNLRYWKYEKYNNFP